MKDTKNFIKKQRYQENTAAARVASKVNYKRNPEAKKDAAHVASKVNYKRNPEAKMLHV